MEYVDDELRAIESNLSNYLITNAAQGGGNLTKFRGLSFEIDDRDASSMCFKVRIASLEAYFSISDGTKVRGSLGGVERDVQKWYLRGDINERMKDLVYMVNKNAKRKQTYRHVYKNKWE